MEDYAVLLEMIIEEMNKIADRKVTNTDRLEVLMSSAKQYCDWHNKAAFTRALNTAKRFLKYFVDEVPSDIPYSEMAAYCRSNENYAKALRHSITNMSIRYMRYVFDFV